MSEIKVKSIADSKSSVNGQRITTFELEYPRFCHSELLTHRMFSRNAASSRAIPVAKMIEMVERDPASPIHWGKNQPGMQAKEELESQQKNYAIHEWGCAADEAVGWANTLNARGVHKQVVNRILEPFQMMKTVLTATEFDNFFWLRNHEDAQPEIKRLAELMLEVMNNSEPMILNPGEWHLPYVARIKDNSGRIHYLSPKAGKVSDGVEGLHFNEFDDLPLEDALAISSSCCAQVSYRLLDGSIEKARMVYKRLVESSPVHASPFEHQATPIKPYTPSEKSYLFGLNNNQQPESWEKGITHVDRAGNFWSGNFKSWIQHRQLIPNNVRNNYEENV